MKAFIYKKYGPPDVLELTNIENPKPSTNQILVKVKATTVNRTDCANLRAIPSFMRITMGLFKPKNPVLGTEFSGEVVEIGSSVKRFNLGDKVFGFSDSGVRSYAEYLVIDEGKGVDTFPVNISFNQAAGCIEGFHYAFNFYNKLPVKRGDKVLINGAAGGIGNAAVQIGKYLGVEITGVCRKKNFELVKSLGAIKVIDFETDDFTKDQDRYHYILDTSGKTSFGKCKHLLLSGGIYISSELGYMWQNVYLALTTYLFGRLLYEDGKKVKFPYPPDIPRSIRFLKEMIQNGEYRSVIDRTYTFQDLPDAFRYVEKGYKTGNVVIDMK